MTESSSGKVLSSTIELPAFITEPFETTEIEYDDETTHFTMLHAATTVRHVEHNNFTETVSNRSTNAKFITSTSASKIIEFTITAKEYGIQFEPNDVDIEMPENWPESYPLPIKPYLRINYDVRLKLVHINWM